jgi:hypothetical protein
VALNGNGNSFLAMLLLAFLSTAALLVSLWSLSSVYREVHRLESEIREVRREGEAQRTSTNDYWNNAKAEAKSLALELRDLERRIEALEE